MHNNFGPAVLFNMYVPQRYTVTTKNVDGTTSSQAHTTSLVLLREFSQSTVKKFQGLTQSNPYATPPLLGVWREDSESEASTDLLVYFNCIVPAEEAETAREHFIYWKGRLEEELHQTIILLYSQSITTFGLFP